MTLAEFAWPTCSGTGWVIPLVFALVALLAFWLGYWGGSSS